MSHNEPKKKNTPPTKAKPVGYGTTKQDLYDMTHHKKEPIQLNVEFRGVRGNASGSNTCFYSDEKTLDWWKNELAPNAEWTLYDIRKDVTGACEQTTREIINYQEPYIFSSMALLTASVALKNNKVWIPSELAPAIISNRGWCMLVTPIRCRDFDRLDSVKEDLRKANRSAVHVRRRTVLLEEANDFGGWFE